MSDGQVKEKAAPVSPISARQMAFHVPHFSGASTAMVRDLEPLAPTIDTEDLLPVFQYGHA